MTVMLTLLSLLVSSGGSMPQSVKALWNHYAIEIPANYRAKNITPSIADFELYEVVAREGDARCVLYFGNAPAFPKYKWPGPPIQHQDKEKRIRVHAFTNTTGTMEGLLEFGRLSYRGVEQSPFSSVHYFCERTSSNQALLFDRMIKSIVVVKPRLD